MLERQVAASAARAARDRLRAGLGDRDRQDGDARDRAGGACLRQVAAPGGRSLRRLGEAGERRAPARSRTWTARSSAAPRSTRRRSRRSASPAPRCCVTDRSSRSSSSTAGGSRRPGPGNAVELADTPVFDALWERYPAHDARRLGRGRRAAARPDGELRGRAPHDRLGARPLPGPDARERRDRGRVVLREPGARLGAFERARERGGDVHLLGLVSYGGVHSHLDHLRALLELAEREGMAERTWIHAFTDGRDVSPHAAASDLAELPAERIATVCGRYYAMDRDQRWERTDRAFAAICLGEGETRRRPGRGGRGELRARRHRRVRRAGRPRRASAARPRRDAAIFFNFRPDRARQLSQRLLEAGIDLTTMTRYRDDFPFPVAFDEQEVREHARRGARRAGLRQLHAAETEKYAHVTYFFNGGEEREWEGETRILVPSPRDVPSYDLKPEMSAAEVAARFCDEVGEGLPLRDRELREPGHGRPHGLDPRRCAAVEARRPLPRARRRLRRARREVLFGDRRPRECRGHARARRREPAHGPHVEPGPARRDRPRRLRLRDGGELSDLAPTILGCSGFPSRWR